MIKCNTDKDCKALGNATCDHPTGICRCNRAHFMSDEEKDAKCISGNVNITDNFGRDNVKSDTYIGRARRILQRR